MNKYLSYIDTPYTVKIEFTRGCNLSCKFCPIDNLKHYSQDKKYLAPDICRKIAEQVKEVRDSGRIELTMRGEPTLNPDVLENLRILREVLPNMQISMFSNGMKCFKNPGLMVDLIDAGVNILNIDCYNKTYDRFKALVEKTIPDTISMKDFRTFSAYKHHRKGEKLRVVNLVPDIQEGEVDVRQIHNNAGNVNPEYLKNLLGYVMKELPLKKGCARPFRELVMSYSGDMLICCHDWSEECSIGNVEEKTIYDMWYGKFHHEILKSMYKKDRSGVPCNKCDYHGGYRLGLLHNPEEKK